MSCGFEEAKVWIGDSQGRHEGTGVVLRFESPEVPFEESFWFFLFLWTHDAPDEVGSRRRASETYSPFV
jgi:hypothetical protein